MLQDFFQSYLAAYQPFKSYWNYEDGCVLQGCRALYAVTDVACYRDFIMHYLDGRVAGDGSVPSFLQGQYCLDSFQCSKALFFADAIAPHGKFARALRHHHEYLRQHPRTQSGLLWHKGIYPQQVWLDGMYMLMPFLAEYAVWSATDAASCIEEIRRAFAFVRKNMCDLETGLYRHGMDEARVQPWAAPQTGLSASCWLRGTGWLLMALVDCIGLLSDVDAPLQSELIAMLRQSVQALLPYRSESGLFYHVIHAPALEGNYTETSGNAMVAYTLLRGGVMGVLSPEQAEIGARMLECLCDQKCVRQPGGFVLSDICRSAGLGGATHRDGSGAYYCSEPRVQNDPKGVGAFMMAHAALLQWRQMNLSARSAG